MLPRFARRLSYHPYLRTIVRAVGMNRVARKLYCALTPQVTITSGGVTATLRTSAECDIRNLDFVITMEKRLLDQVMSRLQPDDVCWDIGAQWGIYTTLAAKRVRTVVAFEPFTASNAILRANIERNHLANVQVSEYALTDHNANLHMSIAACACPRVTDEGELTVRGAQGDDLIARGEVPAPTVIKLDVEGHEYSVLRGMREAIATPSCRMIACEIHPQLLPSAITECDVLSLLSSSGFHLLAHDHRSSEFHVLAVKG